MQERRGREIMVAVDTDADAPRLGMKLLFIGDIVATPGPRARAARRSRRSSRAHGIDVVIANGENAAGGAGVTREITDELFGAGIHVLTSGNHIWDKREVLEFIDREPRLLRPGQLPAAAPGAGSYVRADARRASPVGVINVMGRVFLGEHRRSVRGALREIARVREAGARGHLRGLPRRGDVREDGAGWFLDGQVTAVIGTHTHVQTADERMLPGGTAYLTDVGMTGPHDGIIGMERDGVIARFTTGLPARFEPATGDPRLHARDRHGRCSDGPRDRHRAAVADRRATSTR